MRSITVAPGKLLVKNQTKEQTTASGIILPKVDDNRETPQIVEVVDVGVMSKERLEHDFSVTDAKGKKIVIPKYAGVSIEVDTEELKVIEYDDVLAIVE